jgi:HlyD family secretion protein
MTKKLALLAVAATIGAATTYAASHISFSAPSFAKEEVGTETTIKSEPVSATSSAAIDWIAAAPGRVEPKDGLFHISAQLVGRITDIAVKVNDRVEKGELLIRLDDDEARARLQAAETEAASRKRERDDQSGDKARQKVRDAEDAVYNSERAVTNARFELEYELEAKRNGNGSQARVSNARRNLDDAKEQLKQDRQDYAAAQAKPDVPAPNRLESALQAARSEVAIAEALLEKTRIVAPVAGTVLQLPAKAGELVSPSSMQPLAVLGDMSVVRIKAEVDEHDVSRIKIGGKVTVKSNAYPNREFKGHVAALAPTLTSPKFALRGARRPTDVEVLEVTVDLDGKNIPLLPGMRADAFFK